MDVILYRFSVDPLPPYPTTSSSESQLQILLLLLFFLHIILPNGTIIWDQFYNSFNNIYYPSQYLNPRNFHAKYGTTTYGVYRVCRPY